MPNVNEIKSQDQFDKEVLTGLSAVSFKPGAGYELEKSWFNVAEMYGQKVKFFEVDVDEQPSIAEKEKVDKKTISTTAVPTIKFYKDGTNLQTLQGDDLGVIGDFLQSMAP